MDFEVHKLVNQDFRELVGKHWDLNSGWTYAGLESRPKPTANLFYEKWGSALKEGRIKQPDPKRATPTMYFYL